VGVVSGQERKRGDRCVGNGGLLKVDVGRDEGGDKCVGGDGW